MVLVQLVGGQHAMATIIVKGNITYNNINQGEYIINLGCGIEAVYLTITNTL